MKVFVIGGGSMVVETSSCLIDYLKEDGYEATYTENAEDFTEASFRDCDLLVLNSCLWKGSGDTISPSAKEAFSRHFDLGKGVVVMHSSIGNWDDWPEYIDYVGAVWKWGSSKHSNPDFSFIIERNEEHPLLHNVPDSFEVVDEMYYDLEFAEGNHVVASTSEDQGSHPMVWYRQVNKSRVTAILIGHDERAVSHPVYRQLFRNACIWTNGGTIE